MRTLKYLPALATLALGLSGDVRADISQLSYPLAKRPAVVAQAQIDPDLYDEFGVPLWLGQLKGPPIIKRGGPKIQSANPADYDGLNTIVVDGVPTYKVLPRSMDPYKWTVQEIQEIYPGEFRKAFGGTFPEGLSVEDVVNQVVPWEHRLSHVVVVVKDPNKPGGVTIGAVAGNLLNPFAELQEERIRQEGYATRVVPELGGIYPSKTAVEPYRP